MTTPLLITPAELREALGSVHLLDVRWRLDQPDGRPDYLAGHIPGAVYVDLDADLADHGRPATAGLHRALAGQRMPARRWGIRTNRTVVVYDDVNNLSSARAWWMLRDGGIGDVRVLDGALAGWRAAGYELDTGQVTPTPGDVILRRGVMPVLDIDDAAAFPEFGTLFDARAGERYRGEVEPIDPRAGHIPGAVSAPSAGNLDADGRFLPPEVLRQRFLDLGANPGAPVAAYCGSGVVAAHEALALTLAGFEPAIFPGSWSAWANDPRRPVATGPEPS